MAIFHATHSRSRKFWFIVALGLAAGSVALLKIEWVCQAEKYLELVWEEEEAVDAAAAAANQAEAEEREATTEQDDATSTVTDGTRPAGPS